jgi:hypothetical protein
MSEPKYIPYEPPGEPLRCAYCDTPVSHFTAEYNGGFCEACFQLKKAAGIIANMAFARGEERWGDEILAVLSERLGAAADEYYNGRDGE